MFAAVSIAALLLLVFAGLTVLRLSVHASPNADLVAGLLNKTEPVPRSAVGVDGTRAASS